jgi:hypothetical protein
MKISFSSIRILRYRFLLVLVAVIPVISLLTSCSAAAPAATAPASQPMNMPSNAQLTAEIQNAAAVVKAAYQFALTNSDELKNEPCYCGCGAAGHTSNYSCYVQEIRPNGEVIHDGHALGCSLCVDITQDVMKLTQAGKSKPEIRAAIEQTYSQYGPSNMPAAQ